MELKNSVALVTGGGNGIGEAVVKHFVARGAKVAVVDLVQKNIDRVVADVQKMGGEAIGIQANVTSEADTARFVKGTIEAFGKLNIAVSSAGEEPADAAGPRASTPRPSAPIAAPTATVATNSPIRWSTPAAAAASAPGKATWLSASPANT